MRSSRSSKRVLPVGRILSVGVIALGVGCVAWALVSIFAGQAAVSAAADRAPLVRSAVTLTSVPAPVAETTAAIAQPRVARAPAKVRYPSNASEGETIGMLSIPALGQDLPIIEGTSDSALNKGVGHFAQSVLPGVVDNCVLSGHRDTVFSRLGEVKIGDRLITQTAAGTFTYAVKRIRIVDKNDRTVIVPTKHAVLTVSTCYPFRYVGAAPERYVLVADLVTGN